MKAFRVILMDGDDEAEINLPFAPFAGLWLQIPWRGGDFARVTDAFWYSNKSKFDCHIEPE